MIGPCVGHDWVISIHVLFLGSPGVSSNDTNPVFVQHFGILEFLFHWSVWPLLWSFWLFDVVHFPKQKHWKDNITYSTQLSKNKTCQVPDSCPVRKISTFFDMADVGITTGTSISGIIWFECCGRFYLTQLPELVLCTAFVIGLRSWCSGLGDRPLALIELQLVVMKTTTVMFSWYL